ncbi:class I tRNA ligase family protein [Nocardioides sp.]|uniref:class I tRNA ligase family protein n=1 Tax=Nocardioides sp. TaxID=35761 RepID=UPI0035118CD4
MARTLTSGILDPRLRAGRAPAPHRHLVLGGARVPAVGTARLYVCGITPYDVTHLGHASTFVWADVLAAVLDATGVTPSVCRNITDVDDVLTTAARERGHHYDELALLQQARFEQHMRALRVATPAAEPHARHHVDAVQHLAAALLAAGRAYEHEGWVWFDGTGVPAAAGLERAEAERRLAEYGDAPDRPGQRDPLDVPVWQPSDEGHPAWPSPWGWGRPGWHAECAAMALAVHGAHVDVLVGGIDLAFPHHAYQAALAEAASGTAPFTTATLHVGEVRLDGEKMAKSTGNLVLVDDVLEHASPAALRLLLLDRPVGEPWDHTDAGLARAQERLERLFAAAAAPGPADAEAVQAGVDAALARLLDGLDVPGALAVAEQAGGEVARRLLHLLRLS